MEEIIKTLEYSVSLKTKSGINIPVQSDGNRCSSGSYCSALLLFLILGQCYLCIPPESIQENLMEKEHLPKMG